MNVVVRELISGTVAAGCLVLLTMAGTALPISLVLGTGLYAGLRLLLPGASSTAGNRVSGVEFVGVCRAHLDHLRRLQVQTPRGPITPHLESIVTVVQKLLTVFHERPEQIEAAHLLPEKLHKLSAMLEGYHRLHRHRQDSATAPEALAQTEKLFEVAAGQWRNLLDQLLDTDVVELKVQTRLYENLLEL